MPVSTVNKHSTVSTIVFVFHAAFVLENVRPAWFRMVNTKVAQNLFLLKYATRFEHEPTTSRQSIFSQRNFCVFVFVVYYETHVCDRWGIYNLCSQNLEIISRREQKLCLQFLFFTWLALLHWCQLFHRLHINSKVAWKSFSICFKISDIAQWGTLCKCFLASLA